MPEQVVGTRLVGALVALYCINLTHYYGDVGSTGRENAKEFSQLRNRSVAKVDNKSSSHLFSDNIYPREGSFSPKYSTGRASAFDPLRILVPTFPFVTNSV